VEVADADPLEDRASTVEALRAENAALRAELERIRVRYEAPADPPVRPEETATDNGPEQIALVGPGLGRLDGDSPSDEAWDRLGPILCRSLEEHDLERRWSYYRDERLVPEGVTFFFAHEALRRMFGRSPENDPSDPQAYRRLTASEWGERESVLQAALGRVTETLERSQRLHQQRYEMAALGLLKYAGVLLARFNLALARARVGDASWREALDDFARDSEVEAWVAAQVAHAE
jgi:hypothetical protein